MIEKILKMARSLWCWVFIRFSEKWECWIRLLSPICQNYTFKLSHKLNSNCKQFSNDLCQRSLDPLWIQMASPWSLDVTILWLFPLAVITAIGANTCVQWEARLTLSHQGRNWHIQLLLSSSLLELRGTWPRTGIPFTLDFDWQKWRTARRSTGGAGPAAVSRYSCWTKIMAAY